jgi:lysophospholipase L1-like esterase
MKSSFLVFTALLCAANLSAQINPDPAAKSGYVPDSALIPTIRSTPTNWLSRHEGFVAQAKMGGVDVLFMGDSITDFWRNRGSNVWNKYYAPLHAANFGISGDRTQHVLWRIEHGELDAIKPKVTILMIGTNNSGTDPAADIAKAIKLIIDDIHARIPDTKILLLAIFPRNRPTDKPSQMEIIHQVNDIIATYDDGGKTVKYLDIGQNFLGPDGKVPADIMADFLHPTAKGYQIWADAMNPTLNEMLK